MTSRERVYRAIERRKPERIPLLYCNRDHEHSDVLTTGAAAAASFRPAQPKLTEWGYVWETVDGTMGQPATHPLADDAALDTYVPPDPHAAGRFDRLPDWIKANQSRFLRFGVGITGFNQATFLRGFERFLLDLHENRALAERVLDFVFNYENGLIEHVLETPVDCLAFADDWGTQQGLMISPALWREVFKPRYQRQFARIHQAGKKVWFHSCGNMQAVLGDLIEIGVDVLELLQPDVFGVERLGAEFGGRVCFCCSVDHQRVAVSGNRAEIFAYVRRLKEHLGRFDGGFIGYIEDYACLGMSEANYQAIREAFHQL